MGWCVVRWSHGSGVADEHTVAWGDPHAEDGATVVRRFEPTYVRRDGDRWIRYEGNLEVRHRAQAFADALNGRGVVRERALRQLDA